MRSYSSPAPSTGADPRSRPRVFVMQIVVISMFATLVARLWVIQVDDAEQYAAQAAGQAAREVVVQPARGLIVDAQGRPLVANRTSWVVSIDRSGLAAMPPRDSRAVLRRVAKVTGVPVGSIGRRLVSCGDEGAKRGVCWNGSAVQAVPVALDVPQSAALRILEQPEDFPTVHAVQESARSYPQPFGVNAAHVLGYLSPVTGEEFEASQADGDRSINGASVVGRAGLERAYDAWLRGMPGYRSVPVDSMGRVLNPGAADVEGLAAQAGDTLVTSIDARVQGLVERELASAIARARGTRDTVTGRNYVADSGAVVVMEANTGRIVAMASQPTYDPELWVGGISDDDLERLYSQRAGTPLLGRATQGQFAPGSTWKPFMTAGALMNGYGADTRLNCSSALRVGNRDFKNYESGAYGYIGFAQALEVSCNTFFYRIGLDYWQRFGSDVADVKAKDPLVDVAQDFGFGSETGLDLPGEAAGRIADRRWKREYYQAMKGYYCKVAKEPGTDFAHVFAREFCIEGYAYRAGDAVNFAIGQGDTMVTPLQLARAYAALANGGTLYAPRVAKAVVGSDGTVLKRIAPKAQGRVPVDPAALRYIDQALLGVPRQGTLAWKFPEFPLDQIPIRGKTGSAEVYGKQSTSWVATYDDTYVVVMMISQGGTGSGTSGDAIRAIWEGLYGVTGDRIDPDLALIPGSLPPQGLPTFAEDGAILPPARDAKGARR
jgi:penicillin-binding protein 2